MKKYHKNDKPGNVFNAERDNNGKGVPIGNFIEMLEEYSSATTNPPSAS